MTKHHLLPRVMDLRPKNELRREARVHGPAGERARHLDDVLLRIAAIDTKSVELHQFTRVVLVETALAARPAALLSRRNECWMHGIRRALPLIEIEQHGRTPGNGAEQVAKLSQRIWTNDVAVICRQEDAVQALAGVHAEVILPEIRHHFRELPVTGYRACELRGLQVTENALVLPQLFAKLRIGLENFGPQVLLAAGITRARLLLLPLANGLLALVIHRDELGSRPPEHII